MSQDSDTTLEEAKKLLRSRKFNAAVSCLTEAIAFDQSNASLFECLATAYFLKGDLDKALESFQKVTKLKPTVGRAWINIGAVHNRMGNHKEAVAALRKGIQRERRSAEAHYNLGIAQKGLGQLSMAASAYKQAIKVKPDMAEAHQNLGNVYLEMNNNRQAVACFRKALELRPGFERARKSLAIAENAVSAARKGTNPFGRLVSEDDLASQKTAATFRELTEEERHEDRQLIRGHSGAARETVKELSELLRSQLEPALLGLSRSVSGAGHTNMAEQYDSLRSAIDKAKDLEKQLETSMAQLRAHDKQIRE